MRAMRFAILAAAVAAVPVGCVGELPPFAGIAANDGGGVEGSTPDGGADVQSSNDGPSPETSPDAGICAPRGGAPLQIFALGDGNDQFLGDLAIDDDGNPVLTGSFGGTINFLNGPAPLTAQGAKSDAFVVSIDPGGRWRWGYQYGDGQDQFGTTIAARAGVIFAGGQYWGTIKNLDGDASVTATNDTFQDTILMRFDTAGTVNAHATLGGTGVQAIDGIALPGSGGALLAAENAGSATFSANGITYLSRGSFDAFVGQAITTTTWGEDWGDADGGAPSNQRALAIAVNPATGDIAVAGYFAGTMVTPVGTLASQGNGDAFVAKLDASGKVLWQKRYGDAAEQRATKVAIASNNDIVVAGTVAGTINLGGTDLTSKGNNDVFLARLTADGTHVWSKYFGDAGTEEPAALAFDRCGDILLAGKVSSTIDLGGGPLTSAGSVDVFVAKLHGDGSHVWSHRYGDAAEQDVYAVAASPVTGEVFFGGAFKGTLDLGGGNSATSAGNFDAFVAKLTP